MNLSKISKRIVIFTICIAVSACAPYPHEITTNPGIKGVLLRDGKPVPNTKVMISGSSNIHSPCENALPVVETSVNGEFEIPSKKEWQFFYSFLNPPKLTAQLINTCFEINGKLVLGDHLISQHLNPQLRILNCDLVIISNKPTSGLVGIGTIICRSN